jgi:hypothetical protein
VINERKSDKIFSADCHEGDGEDRPVTRSYMMAE